ncbi:universal stress protein [Nocardia carnea]|uniref:universal stress protein n=1 Tax=Nocardia carnea TaxID=37328 RepID=UPI002456CE69|nr:universal stress protein [Nocardia carnea]
MSAPPRSPVVVGVDGSSGSTTALRWAARTAARRQAPLHLVCAVGLSGDRDPEHGAFDDRAFRHRAPLP